MLFNSIEFFIFFFIVFFLYCFSNLRWQNAILLIASYWFYGSWDWRFLSLIWISTIVDYVCGLKIAQHNEKRHRKKYLLISIFINLSILGFFKYFNFFIESLSSLLLSFGLNAHWQTLNVILPVGISFYTFQTMSYTVDIYFEKIKPTKNFLNFAVFVAFFPQLVAGPIERAKHLLPQVESQRKLTLEQFYQGSYLILWGLFQKVFVADNLAKVVDPVFTAQTQTHGIYVLMAVYAFSFQIFCDFAGYSNIARGLSKCMGFDIMVNFNLPYFASNPREFWQRWHISLSSWLRDYLYIPLGGNKKGTYKTYRNLSVTMLLGGLWHGAAWTFVIWGAYHGLLLVIHRFFNKIFRSVVYKKLDHSFVFFVKVIFFFHVVSYGWLIFRAQSFDQVISMTEVLLFHWEGFNITSFCHAFNTISPYVLPILCVQLFQYRSNDLMFVYNSRLTVRLFFYFLFIFLIIIFGVTGGKEFIYFQF